MNVCVRVAAEILRVVSRLWGATRAVAVLAGKMAFLGYRDAILVAPICSCTNVVVVCGRPAVRCN